VLGVRSTSDSRQSLAVLGSTMFRMSDYFRAMSQTPAWKRFSHFDNFLTESAGKFYAPIIMINEKLVRAYRRIIY
ncbi:hypothetical protein, partial [Burkholderia ubonensis]|uniref:hypothetical protein n=1 Tax=Burkholderia ubonensis TaxID=101571 RepID=UPI001E638822